jgi:soluble lytic murein transglycosylase-like protein
MKQQATCLAVLASLLLASPPAHAAAHKSTHHAAAKPSAKVASSHASKTAAKAASAKAVAPKTAKAADSAKTAAKAPAPPAGDPLNPLSPADVSNYRAAFAAAEKGDDGQRDAALAKVSNSSLRGRVLFAGLTRKGERPAYAELTGWLGKYGDQAGADRIYDMAMKAKPRRAKAPRAPSLVLSSSRSVGKGDKAQAARNAYYGGDVRKALTLAMPAGEHWIAGLADYRLDHYDDAKAQFAIIARDRNADPWLRAAAGYWAGRSAAQAGTSSEVQNFLKIAAEAPQTFYGMIAERQLAMAGVDAAFDPIGDLLAKTAEDTSGERARTARFAASDPRARRAAALAQVGRSTDAGDELRTGLASARTDAARDGWMALALALNPQVSAGRAVAPKAQPPRRADAAAFPLPALQPKGGFTLDPALVYALVRQESGFNPLAISSAGAVGLMQLMPEAAARAAGDDKLKLDMTPLFDPAINLRVGQDYFSWLMERGLNDFDLLRAVAAYNGGPATLIRAAAQLGPDADSLLLIESLPALETRNYVEKVTAAYWTYRRLFGLPSGTLDALARGAKSADIRLDVKGAPPAQIAPAA